MININNSMTIFHHDYAMRMRRAMIRRRLLPGACHKANDQQYRSYAIKYHVVFIVFIAR